MGILSHVHIRATKSNNNNNNNNNDNNNMATAEEYPLEVDYCGLCGLPPEYCEFGAEPDKCKEWLKENIPDLYEDLVAAVEELSVDGEEKKVILSTETRSKRKSVTIVKGLSTFDIDAKKAAKMMSNRFACGASVAGGDEIVIQGDVAYDLIDFLQEKFPEIDEDSIEDNT